MSGTGQGSRAGLLQPFSCILVTLITLPRQDNQILMRRGRLTNTNNFWVYARSVIQEVTGSDTGMGHIFQTRAGSYWNKTDRAALIRHNSAAIYSILFPFQCDILAARIGEAFPLKFCNLVWLERTFQLLNKRNQSGPSLAMTYCQSKTAGMVGWMDFLKAHIWIYSLCYDVCRLIYGIYFMNMNKYKSFYRNLRQLNYHGGLWNAEQTHATRLKVSVNSEASHKN